MPARVICKGSFGPAFKVAICEQMEEPSEAKKRGSKAVVRRDVVRLVTAGTLSEEALDARRIIISPPCPVSAPISNPIGRWLGSICRPASFLSVRQA